MMTARLAQKPGVLSRRRGEAIFARRLGRLGFLGVSVTEHLAYCRWSSFEVGPQSPVLTAAPGRPACVAQSVRNGSRRRTRRTRGGSARRSQNASLAVDERAARAARPGVAAKRRQLAARRARAGTRAEGPGVVHDAADCCPSSRRCGISRIAVLAGRKADHRTGGRGTRTRHDRQRPHAKQVRHPQRSRGR